MARGFNRLAPPARSNFLILLKKQYGFAPLNPFYIFQIIKKAGGSGLNIANPVATLLPSVAYRSTPSVRFAHYFQSFQSLLNAYIVLSFFFLFLKKQYGFATLNLFYILKKIKKSKLPIFAVAQNNTIFIHFASLVKKKLLF